MLVGTDKARIIGETERLLGDADFYRQMAGRDNPYGDGEAAVRIAGVIRRGMGKGDDLFSYVFSFSKFKHTFLSSGNLLCTISQTIGILTPKYS